MDKVVNKRTRKRSEGKRRFIESWSDPPKVGSEQRKERPYRRCRYRRRARFHEADNPRTEARRAERPLRVYLYTVYIYIHFLRARACTYAHSAGDTPLRAGRLHLYTDVLGTEIWRDPLDSTRLAIIQFIGLSKAPVHAVFPDRSLSLPLFLCLSPAPFRPFPSRSLFHAEPTLLLFLPFEYTSLQSPALLSAPPDITVFCLSSSRAVPLSRFSVSVRHAATLRSRPPGPFGVEND